MTRAARITRAILRYRRLAAALFICAVLLLAAGLPRVDFAANSRNFMGEDIPEFVDVLRMDETYTLSNNVLLMLIPPEGQAFSPETLRALQAMTEDAWQMPYALRVDSPINHMHSYSEGDEIFVEPMLDAFEDVTPAAAERFRDLAMASKRLRNALLSENGDAFGMLVRVVLPRDAPGARREVVRFVAELREDWTTRYPGWEVRAAGGVLGNALLARVAFEDILYLVPVAIAAAIALFSLALGSLRAVSATLAVLVCATVATYGFAGWTGVALTAATAISPLAVMVLTSTSCIHITLGTIRAAEDGERDAPFQRALERNLAPVTVSHLTTAFGFLCLNFAPSPPLADMGNIVAFGLLMGYVAVFALLPAFLSRFVPGGAGPLMISADRTRSFAAWVLRRARLWLILFPLAGLTAAFGLSRIDYDDNNIRYFDQRYQLRQDAEAIESRLTGLDTIQFSFAAPEGGSVFTPDFLRGIDRFAAWLEAQPYVVNVSGLHGIIKELNQSMSGDAPQAYAIADSQQANAQLLMFYELSLPVGMDLNVMMDVDRTQTLLTANLRAPHSADFRKLAARAETWLAENEPDIATRATGMGIAFARISERNNERMLFGFLTVLCLVSLTLIVTLRSLRHGVISLVPNLLPALLAFGFWGLTIGDLNLGSTVVTTMTFGIVVDDTVHFLMHYLRCRRRDLNVDAALADTFAVVGSSITLTSVALMVGFAIMSASGFSINQHIGLLTTVVIGFALLCDMLFLPAVLRAFQGKPR